MKTAWDKYDVNGLKKIMDFSEKYKDFLSKSKTERETVRSCIELLKENGFKDFKEIKKLSKGDKIYFVNREKALVAFVIGEEKLEKGLNILGAHIDSPRIDVKQNPLYEDHNLVLMDTHYYGGIKKYQWVATPLAIHGVVCKKDGTTVDINIGEDENDPVFGISDLLIHLAKDQMQKTADKVVEGEDLNALVGTIPLKYNDKDPVKEDVLKILKEKYNKDTVKEDILKILNEKYKKDEVKESVIKILKGEYKKGAVKENVLKILKEKYKIEEADFISAELELVPAGKARDLGFDRSIVMGYGHDDRICAYTSLMALIDEKNFKRTAVCILTDKEEVGSIGSTGAQSAFFDNAISELINLEGDYSDLKLRRCLRNSLMLSSDVSAAYDPNYPSVNELKNTAYFGGGIAFVKFTGSRGKSGSSDANAEFVAKVRKVMDDNDISFQFNEIGRVDQGGGGTIAYILANKDMEVLDAGIAVQNMHAPYETASKVDIYEAYKAYKAFLKEMK